MLTTKQALKKGFQDNGSSWEFKFGDNEEYELMFEPLIWDEQMYVALYKNQELLTDKVVAKPGYIKEDEHI